MNKEIDIVSPYKNYQFEILGIKYSTLNTHKYRIEKKLTGSTIFLFVFLILRCDIN